MNLSKRFFYFFIGVFLGLAILLVHFGSDEFSRIFGFWLPNQAIKREATQKPRCEIPENLSHFLKENNISLEKMVLESKIDWSKSHPRQTPREYAWNFQLAGNTYGFLTFIQDSVCFEHFTVAGSQE